MSKPSDVAMGLADRFTLNAIRAAHALKQDFCTDAGCVCGGHQLVRDAALTIDAAIQRAVERERERVLVDVAQGIGTEYARASDGGWRATCEAMERLQDRLAALRATPN